MPFFSQSTSPASRSFAMWWETVACASSRSAVKSQMHTGDFAFQSAATIVRRAGSASAFIRVAVLPAHAGSTSGMAQQTPFSRKTGRSLTAIKRHHTTTHRHLSMGYARIWERSTNIDGRRMEMGEVREAVRSRYANAAKQLVVFNELGTGPEGCCQADGPDCGCSGSYSAEALREIGLTESVSLGCGNPTMLADLKPGETVLDLGS